MWDIEVNIAGYRFTHHAPDRRRRLLAPLISWPGHIRQHVRQLRAA